MFVKALDPFKCGELKRALWLSLLKIDVFDEQMKVEVAEIFWGAPPSQASHFWGASLSHTHTIMLGPKNTT